MATRAPSRALERGLLRPPTTATSHRRIPKGIRRRDEEIELMLGPKRGPAPERQSRHRGRTIYSLAGPQPPTSREKAESWKTPHHPAPDDLQPVKSREVEVGSSGRRLLDLFKIKVGGVTNYGKLHSIIVAWSQHMTMMF